MPISRYPDTCPAGKPLDEVPRESCPYSAKKCHYHQYQRGEGSASRCTACELGPCCLYFYNYYSAASHPDGGRGVYVSGCDIKKCPYSDEDFELRRMCTEYEEPKCKQCGDFLTPLWGDVIYWCQRCDKPYVISRETDQSLDLYDESDYEIITSYWDENEFESLNHSYNCLFEFETYIEKYASEAYAEELRRAYKIMREAYLRVNRSGDEN